ncbi:MAG: hypothetical protein IPG86_20155 [Chitinophagaceae bacterium]|nr:hypothetical protein [Chitinophagaceae bacterium]
MKKIYFLLLIISLGFTQCKKTIDNIQEDLVTKAMTDGQWIVTKFIYNGTTITADFNGYHFKYYDNPKKVDAVKNGTLELTGNWGGNSADMTTWANFTGAVYPLNLINGTWNITRNSWTYVEATQNSGTETKTMRLDKQ